jgi:hypothetical protein
LLAAVHAVECVVDIEHDALRHRSERAAVLLDERPAETQQGPCTGDRPGINGVASTMAGVAPVDPRV